MNTSVSEPLPDAYGAELSTVPVSSVRAGVPPAVSTVTISENLTVIAITSPDL